MKKGNVAKLTMKRPLCTGQILDEQVYECELLSYDVQQEAIRLILNKATLADLSLEAIYECQIIAEEAKFLCDGTIVERYCDDMGKIVKMQIKNGFYKISIK